MPSGGPFTEGYDNGAEDASKGLPKRYRPIRATAPGGDYRRGYDAGYADHGGGVPVSIEMTPRGQRMIERQAAEQGGADPK